MKRVLFVCVENSNRSQMAQAFAKMYGQDVIQAESAGSRPSGTVNPRAVIAMSDLGYDLTTHTSKSLGDVSSGGFDYVITMGCGDDCPFVEAKHREDWDLPDPKALPPNEFNQVRDEIELRVRRLVIQASLPDPAQ